MHLTKTRTTIINLMFVFLLIMLINGRSFLGLYVLGFRIAEYLTGFAIIGLAIVIYKYKYLSRKMNSSIVKAYLLLCVYFVTSNLINNISFTNLYSYQSSVFIWYISFIFIGYLIFRHVVITEIFYIFGLLGLAVQYVFNVLYYPEFLNNFFNLYSDKTQFLKGSEIAIFFISITFLANRNIKKSYVLDIFILLSSIYFPLTIFKSRSAGMAIGLFIIVEIFMNRNYFKKNIKKTGVLFILSSILFVSSSFYLIDNPPKIEKAEEAVAQVFKHKYVVSNTWDEEVPFLYFFENRLFSADGNLNWRLQLWQDLIKNSIDEGNVVFGIGFGDRSSVFEDEWYSGSDKSNENSHNYLLNVYVRAGLAGLFLVLYFFYKLVKSSKKELSTKDFLIFFTPLAFISLFDGSMENPYFTSTFYFLTGSFFSGIKSTSRKVVKNS